MTIALYFDAGNQLDIQILQQQVEIQAREIQRLQGTATHYRSWASQLQARYQLFSPDAARPAKRVYIGNLPPEMTDAELRTAVNDLLIQCGGAAGEGLPVVASKIYTGAYASEASGSCPSEDNTSVPDSPSAATTYSTPASAASLAPPPSASSDSFTPGSVKPMHPLKRPTPQEKAYAFVELRSVEEASNCMALDGVRIRDAFIKVRRPNNYDPSVAIMLGPVEPNPALDLSALEVMRTVVHDTPHKVFVGGLPCDWTEDLVTEMLTPFGPLKAFNLVMDRATGKSRGYAFCEFRDVSVTDAVIQALNGKSIGSKFLTGKS